MSGLSEISLNTTGGTFLLILSMLAAVALSYFIYRNTIPPVPLGWRITLISLRALAVMIVILLLFEPILSITREKQERPVVAVLIDTSASMGLVDKKVNRRQELEKILSSELFEKSSDFEFEFYPYSYQLFDAFSNRPDSLSLAGDGTDIRRALEELKEQLAEKYFAATILISDGADNLGENPARYATNYSVPIFPVGIGDPGQQKDVLITNYATNEIAYAGTRIPVDVYIRSSGFSERRVALTLLQDGQELASETVLLSGNNFEQKIRLHFTPQQEGLHKYELLLPKLDGELTTINNSKSFYIKVLKSKLQVLVIAGGPSPDYLFLQRMLKNDENIEFQAYIEKGLSRFYQASNLPKPAQLAGFDCILLLDYPRSTSNTDALEKIKEVLSKGKPLLLLSGKRIDYSKLQALKDFLPLASAPSRAPEQSTYLKLLPQGIHHPLFRLAEQDAENQAKWQELPPTFFNINSMQLHPSAQSLAARDVQRSSGFRGRAIPLIVILNTGQRKSVAVVTYGLWRWDLLMQGAGKTNDSYRTFLQNTIRWLTTEDDSKLVRVTSNKEIYRSGEEVKFTAQVYFEDYQPVDNADVSIELRGDKGTQNLTLLSTGQGRYEGQLQVLEGGDYQFFATAHSQGRILGRDTGKFSVEEFNLEYQNTRMNEDLLRRIASASGGKFYSPAHFIELKEKFAFPKKFTKLKNEWEIWNRMPLLIACILLLSVEWFIRKRKGML